MQQSGGETWDCQPFHEMARRYALSADSADEEEDDEESGENVNDNRPVVATPLCLIPPSTRTLSQSPARLVATAQRYRRSPSRSPPPPPLPPPPRSTTTHSEVDISAEAHALMANIEARLDLLKPFPELANTRGTLMLGLSPAYRNAFAIAVDGMVAESTKRHEWASLLQQHTAISLSSLHAHSHDTRRSDFFTRHYDTTRAPFQKVNATDPPPQLACAICCFPLETSPTICILIPCQHVFHASCFAEHVMKTDSIGTLAALSLSKQERMARLCIHCCLCRAVCDWSAFEDKVFQTDHTTHVAQQ
jgi:hypothetical protein